eukprot:snap_masked-scaffold_10-processed-gene-4.34-mRNA-1 protein AED:1.00 eAED:1.00 QI:0/0/0/0/1/1/2/0/74
MFTLTCHKYFYMALSYKSAHNDIIFLPNYHSVFTIIINHFSIPMINSVCIVFFNFMFSIIPSSELIPKLKFEKI